MRFLFSLILTLFAITAQSQVMKLTSAGKPISISIDDIVFVRAGTPSGSVITYGQTQARLNVSQTMSAIQSASCSNLVSLSVVENISGQPQSTTLLFNVRMIAEVIPDVNNKAVMTIRTSPRVKYTTVSSYTSVTNTISACITGGGGGGSVVTDATLSGDGSSGDPLSVNPIETSLIENNAVTNGKLATMPALTIKGNNTGATGAALDLTKVQVQSMLSVDDLITLTGVAEGNTNLLTFTGTIIPNNSTIKAALQALETAVEIIGDTITVSDSPKIDLTMLNRNITATLVPGGVALTDIAASGASNGQIIKFNGTNWVVGSDVTGSSIDSSFQKLAGIVAGGYANKRYTDNKWSRGKMLIGFNPTNYVSLDTLGQIIIAPPATGTTTAILFKQSGSANSILKTDGSNPFELDGPYTILKSTGSNPFIEFSTPSNGTYRIDYNSALFRLYNQGASKSMLSIHTSAANNALFVDASTNLVVGGTSTAIAKIQAYTTSGATSSMLGMLNSTGTTRFFRSNATPEAAITGIVGDWTFSTTGLFAKITGSGNTGWGEYMNLKKSHGATSGQLLKWNGTTWAPAADDGNVYTGGVGISVAGTVINNDGVTSINGEIGDVVDYVKLTDPVGSTGGDVTGTIDNMIVIGLSGTPIDGTPPTLGQVLAFDGTNWIPTTTGSGGGGITNFTAVQGAAPGVAASSHDGETFRNDVYGELWGSNGSVWYPFSYGGKECQDTVLVSAITVQPGGSVTTGSPLVRSSLGVWEHLYNYATPNTIPDGVVTDVVSGPRAIIQYCGVRKGSGATPNSSCYVDQSANTGFTTTKPASNIRPLGKIASNGDFLVNAGLLFSKDNFPGIIRNASLAGSGIVGDTLRISTGDKGDIDVTLNGLTWTVDTNAITTIKIINSAVDSNKIAPLAVQTSDIANAAVTMLKIAQAGATTNQVIKWNGSAWAPGTDTGASVAQPLDQIAMGTGTVLKSYSALKFDTTNYYSLPQRVFNIGDSATYLSRRLEGLHFKNRFGVPGGVYRGINYTPLVIESPTQTSESLDFRFRQSVAVSQSYPGPPGTGCTNCPSDSTRNEVMTWGFNENGSQKSNMPGIHYALEPGWYNGGQFWQEAHLEFYNPYFNTAPFTAVYGTGKSIRRLFTTEVQNIKSPLLTTNIWNFVGDGFNMNSLKSNAQYFKTSFNESTGTSEMVLWGGRTSIAGIRMNVDTLNNIFTIDRVGSYSSTTSRFDFAGYSRYDWRNDLGVTIFSYQRAANRLLFGSTGIRNSFYFQANNYNSGDGLLVSGDLTNSSYLNRGHIWLYNAGFSRNWHMGYRTDADFAYMTQDGGTTPFSASFKKFTFGTNVGGAYPKGTGFLNIYSNQANTIPLLLLESSTDSARIFVVASDPNSVITGRVGNFAFGTNGKWYGKFSGSNTNTGWGAFLNLVDANSATSGQVLGWNGTTWGPVAASAGGWLVTGNTPTTANFLGSTNNVGLRFRTNNIQYMILDSLGRLGVNVALPTAKINVTAGTATAGTSPVKFTTTGAVLLTTPEAGVLEVGASDNRIYYTGSSATRNTIAYLTDSLAVSLLKKGSATTNQVIKWNGTNWAPATDVSLANTDQTLTANRVIALGTNSLTVSSSVVADQSITATFNNDGIVMSATDASGVDPISGELFLSGAFASIGVDNGVSATSYTNYQNASSTWKWNDITITLDASNGISIANAETNDGMKYTANNENAILLTDRNVPDMNTVRRNNRERFTDVTSTTSPVNLTSTNKDNLINQGGTQATFTFNLPATPGDGQICELTFSNIVTTLTIGAQGGITILGTAPTTAAVGTQLRYKYYATITSWIRVL